jgi:hypothetical protein
MHCLYIWVMSVFYRTNAKIQIAALSGFLLAGIPQLAAQESTTAPTESPQQNQPSVPPAKEPGHHAYTPLTAPGRLGVWAKDCFGPLSFIRSGASAGLGQWRDTPKEWKQGAEAYGRRYASGFAQHVTGATLVYGASSIFHEDNRYVRSDETGFRDRSKYALESTFLARHTDGTRHVSISRIIGFTGAALISRLWQPPSTRGMHSAAVSLATEVGASAGFNMVREFLHKN